MVSAEPFSHGTGTLWCLRKEMTTYRHWSVSLWRDPDDVSHCRILSPDKTEWWLISATLCRWRRCFVADQLWLVTHRRRRLNVIVIVAFSRLWLPVWLSSNTLVSIDVVTLHQARLDGQRLWNCGIQSTGWQHPAMAVGHGARFALVVCVAAVRVFVAATRWKTQASASTPSTTSSCFICRSSIDLRLVLMETSNLKSCQCYCCQYM